ncbi:MAG: hypothetical protein GY703_24665, partial [Gammaproteobacteria bacterium]|nr:hypothetical protein [Gammaproteobacteria bacterium]
PIVIEYLKYRFPIGHNHMYLPEYTYINHQSALNNADAVQAYLDKEVRLGAMLGPFPVKPFTWIAVSPMLCRDKDNGTAKRVIVDLSYPAGRSVNDGIDKEDYLGASIDLSLPSALSLKHRIRELGKDAWLWSVDLIRAYRQLRGDPLDYPLLGLHWEGLWYVDSSIAFGLRTGALPMQTVTQSIIEILETKGHRALAYI